MGCQAVGGPPEASGGWPLLGHIVPIQRSPLGFLPGLAKYGAVVKIGFGTLPVYVVAHPDAVRDVLVPGDIDYKRGLCFERLKPGLGEGIATASVDEHRRLRTLLQPVFSRERLVEYSTIMRTAAEEAVQKWHDGEVVQADEAMDDLALTALTRSLFRFTATEETAEAIKHGMRELTRTLKETSAGGLAIPADAEMIYSPYLLHHDARWFPDPQRFDPDRWLPENAAKLPKNAYIPFAAGAYQCIGKIFATTELAMMTAVICAKWRAELTPGTEVREVASALITGLGPV
ncbi:cytochrome P450 [Kutzneria sp. 744]|uniref:cytochrome P450 n=1 Tax=Kutzneria sp. (strain 744) TaxID=345341 RepID=UPI0003EEB5C5|nr:cytochrome P450 [Kutzneria sp. 744]EWM18407.1 cytochrome P450 [Kutzneria sp. 744]